MAQNILVTGGAGYIGSTLVPMLLEAGYNVTVLDNFMYKQASLNHACFFKNLNIVRGDIRDESIMRDLLKKNDIVIPLAAFVGAPLCKLDPVGAQTVNHDAILMMLRNLSKQQKVLMPTTNSAYGSGDKDNFCTEESPLNPISKYAIDKVEVEKHLMQHENAISFRLATVFGMSPRMRLDLLVNDFVYRAVNDKFLILFEGHFKRNYIHVRDVSNVFLYGIAKFDQMKGNIFNVGLSTANLSKIELCEEIKKIVAEFYFIEASVGKDPDQRNYIVSNKKIENLGFQTKVSILDGIIELVKGYRYMNNKMYGNI